MTQHLLQRSPSTKDKALAVLTTITRAIEARNAPKSNLFFGYTDHSKTLPLALIPGKILPFLNFVDLLQVELTCLDFFNLINSEQYCHVIWNSLIGVGTMSKAEAAKRRQLI